MDGSRCFAYDSVYFDTAQLDSYLLAAHGRRRRYKIRTRTYVDSAISFLEVKTEGAREATVKERIPYDLSDRARLTAEGLDYVHETLAAAVGDVPVRPAGARAGNPLPPHHAVPARIRQPGHHRHGRHLAAPRRAGLGPGRRRDPRDQVRLDGRPAGPAPLGPRRPALPDLQVRHRHGGALPRPAGQPLEPDAAPHLALRPAA